MRHSYYFFLAFLFLPFSTASSRHSREINKIIPLHADGRLVVDTYKGSITVTTHDKQQVEVNVRIETDDSDSRDAARDVENTEIEMDGNDSEVTLHTNYKDVERHRRSDFWGWISHPFECSNSLPLVHYTIKMPRTALLKIKDYKSQTRIENVTSDIIFKTYKGEAEINNVLGGVDAETYKGTVHVSFSRMNTDSRFETQKGAITVAVPKDNGFDLQTYFERHVHFNTDFDVQTIERNKKHRHYDYRGNISGGGPRLRLYSNKGDIRLMRK